mmetsp:Transcript_44441/g.105301  ORF Transcript_44441/g.105301 Transcript_44441/m.105301 type:complete len:377 (-) Transcript_44441:118-1248(-)|eukprot:CAMPEP_0178403558 /NCGR_PEP_ID=MMETSP0689_2-20121128/17431_1 /TAXON_ID=160604 /ORGANISM="Amphidinium massartii, Strain CS-259" /LENGTH=376 /DNA_ID=CAMNT_0020024517 /DNA_START=62 /DNA_END=1192 /DNA_ORIENTATION=+
MAPKPAANSSEAYNQRKEKTKVRLAKQTNGENLSYIRESVKPNNGHTWILEPVAKYIKELLAAGSVVPAPAVTPPPAARGSPSSGSVPALTDGAADAQEGGEGDAGQSRDAAGDKKAEFAKMMAKKFVHQNKELIKQPVVDIKFILTSIEPNTCSNPALRALATRGAKEASKTALCMAIEFATGVAAADQVYEVWETLGQLVEHCKAENIKRGRPLLWHSLASQWEEDGVYEIKLSESGLDVMNRITEVRVTVPFSVVNNYKIVQPYRGLSIINNFSDKDAAVVQKGTLGKLPLLTVIGLMAVPAGAPVRAPPSKRPRMLENVVPTEPDVPQQQLAVADESALANAAEDALAEDAEQQREEEEKQDSEPPSPPDST